MKPSPNKLLIKCGFLDCEHSCVRNRNDNDYPPDGIPPEKITVKIGDRRRAMFCTGCHRYTVYVLTKSEQEDSIKKYQKDFSKKRGEIH